MVEALGTVQVQYCTVHATNSVLWEDCGVALMRAGEYCTTDVTTCNTACSRNVIR